MRAEEVCALAHTRSSPKLPELGHSHSSSRFSPQPKTRTLTRRELTTVGDDTGGSSYKLSNSAKSCSRLQERSVESWGGAPTCVVCGPLCVCCSSMFGGAILGPSTVIVRALDRACTNVRTVCVLARSLSATGDVTAQAKSQVCVRVCVVSGNAQACLDFLFGLWVCVF